MLKLRSALVVVLLALLIIGCGEQDHKVQLFTEQQQQEISAKIDELMNKRFPADVPGAALGVICEGTFIHKKGYGLADLEKNLPFTPSTPCYLGSVSKQFTAMAIMILKDRGMLTYEDKLRSFFPDTPEEWDDITVWHLLTHTSGLIDIFKIAGNIKNLTNEMAFQKNVEHRVLDFKTGSKYSYSNSGYIMLALIVEKVSGQPFNVFIKENIFDPLGMSKSLVYDENKPEILQKARGYRQEDGVWQLFDYNILTVGAGGYYSTIEDLFKWDQALYTEKLVKKETLDEAFTAQVDRNENQGYGFAWVISEYKGMKRIGHTGSLRGFRTYIGRFPEKEFTIVILTNGLCTDRDKIVDEILGYYFPGETVPSN